MSSQHVPPRLLLLHTRAWLAFICFWRVLVERSFAKDVARLVAGPPDDAPAPTALPPPGTVDDVRGTAPAARQTDALQLLSLFQREGRLIDFLEQDVAAFSDAEVGAAARVVHDGCRRALRAHARVSPLLAQEEGAKVTVPSGFSPAEIKLTGDVRGSAPFTGTLRHRGWRASELALPTPLLDDDATVLAPAEVEL